MSLTTDRNDPELKTGQLNETGQHKIYLVLSEEERGRGFVRPFRDTYVHVGRKFEEGEIQSLEEGLINCSDWAKEHYTVKNGYAAFLKYPESKSPLTGIFLTNAELDSFNKKGKGCGVATKMGEALSETYARDPKFYSHTFCVGCNVHLPVSEFKWDDGETVGS